jgi:hypothetical protein
MGGHSLQFSCYFISIDYQSTSGGLGSLIGGRFAGGTGSGKGLGFGPSGIGFGSGLTGFPGLGAGFSGEGMLAKMFLLEFICSISYLGHWNDVTSSD